MQGFDVSFRVWASTQEEADELAHELQNFVNDIGGMGYYVTAPKTAKAVKRWKENSFIKNQILKYYEREM